ncbi:transposase [Desulfatibacillum aliphaticivorans]
MAKSEDRLSSVYQQINGGNSGTHPCSKRQTGPHSNVASGLALPQGKACCSLEKSKTSSAAKSDKMSGTCTNPKDVYSLGDVVGAFKSLSTREINKRFNRSGPIWQPNYYEHVIRNERSLNLAREYIMNNPAKWAYDKENPMKK